MVRTKRVETADIKAEKRARRSASVASGSLDDLRETIRARVAAKALAQQTANGFRRPAIERSSPTVEAALRAVAENKPALPYWLASSTPNYDADDWSLGQSVPLPVPPAILSLFDRSPSAAAVVSMAAIKNKPMVPLASQPRGVSAPNTIVPLGASSSSSSSSSPLSSMVNVKVFKHLSTLGSTVCVEQVVAIDKNRVQASRLEAAHKLLMGHL